MRRLEQGARHAFTVLTSNNFVDTGAAGNVSSTFSWPSNTRWAFHTVADRGGAPVPAPVIDYVTLYPNCEAVRAHYPGGATRSSPIYRSALDSDGDGIACESAPTPPTPVTPLDPISNLVTSSSTSASATVELKLTVKLKNDVPVGGAFVLYLEDDFQEPDSISASDVYFVSTPSHVTTGNGSRVYATVNPEIDTDDHFTADKKDIDIRVSVPDVCTTDTPTCQGANGLRAGDTVTMVIQKSAGIKNPSEAGTHSTGYAILGPTDNVPSGPNGTGFMKANELSTVAKITLSDVDNSRGYEMTVTGSGFNNGTTAGVYVLHDPAATPDCQRIISEGTLVGHSVVGSDDRIAVTFEVTVPPFGPGNTNYICMVDGEGRMSDTDVEDFSLQPSIRVAPSVASVGDVVTVFAQDFPNPGAAFVRATLAGRPVSGATGTSVRADGSATATITVPTGVIGIVRLDAEWGGIREDTKLHVIP